ncbi:hypothetical protein CLV86_0527 [Lacinutrix venerupis]|uniref:hypothetical protein n=1 Tax=Lacinutrix venerupis TaxID=1486034 RepID=UPI000EB2CD67|nr:hypothetical protein [Lacinutrix venerupis]RLJ69133.1 hypothetical protein CLV86_0527 [Lacinutrix venerupis]
MKTYVKYLVICLGLIVFNCKDEKKPQALEKTTKTETSKPLSKAEKTEIVRYYLINGRKLQEKDFHEIIFLNDVVDGVKVIHYEGKDAFFSFKFSEALKFYNENKK